MHVFVVRHIETKEIVGVYATQDRAIRGLEEYIAYQTEVPVDQKLWYARLEEYSISPFPLE